MLTKAYKPTLSCAHCIVSGYTFVYNNKADDTDNTFYKDLKTTVTVNPGFCCRKVGAAYICEEDYKIFNFLSGLDTISASDITAVRTLLDNIKGTSTKGGETVRDTLLSSLYAEIGKDPTTDKAAILLGFQRVWADAVLYDMVDSTVNSGNANGLDTLAQLNNLMGYVNAIGKSNSNYTTHVEPQFLLLRSAADYAAKRTVLEKCKLYSVLYAKDATNAKTIIDLLTSTTTDMSSDATAANTQTTERATLVAFANGTAYSSSSDSVSTQIVTSWRKVWTMWKWTSTDYNAAISSFSSIASATLSVERGYGTALQTTFDDQYKSAFSATTKTDIQEQLYWYKKKNYAQFYKTIKSYTFNSDSALTTAKGLLDKILVDLKAQSKDTEITALLILYSAASICDDGDTKISKSLVAKAITQFDAYCKSAAQTSASSSLIAANYKMANFIVQYYAGSTASDAAAKNLQMTNLENVFYWATQLCLDSTQQGIYDTESTNAWKTQTNDTYVYVRDAIILNNFKNQSKFTNKTTETTNWDKFLSLITANDVAGTVSASKLGATAGTVTGTASFLIGSEMTQELGYYYQTASGSPTSVPEFWKASDQFSDIYLGLAQSPAVSGQITADAYRLLVHRLMFLQKVLGQTQYDTTWSVANLKAQLVAGSGSAYDGDIGDGKDLRLADITDFTSLAAIKNVTDYTMSTNDAYWYDAYFEDFGKADYSGLKYANVVTSGGSTFSLSTATVVSVQAPEPVVAVEEPVVEAIPQAPIVGLSNPATGPNVGANFDNPDPSASGFLRSDQFTSKWLALTACPRKVDVCGARDITVGSSETTFEIGKTTAMKHTDQCTYILADASGIPQVRLKSVSSGSLLKYKIVYVEYDDKWAGPPKLAMDTTVTTVPDKATAVNWVDDVFAYAEGTLGLFKIKNGDKNFRYLNANYLEEIIKDFKAAKSAYDGLVSTYNSASTAYDTAATAITAEIAKLTAAEVTIDAATWTALPLRPVAPLAPAAYAGVHETSADLTKHTGYGSPTAGEITLSLAYGTYKYFGVFGQGLTDGKLGYSSTTGTTNKYIILTVYPTIGPEAGWTQSNGSNGTELLTLGVKSTTASTHDLADPGAVTTAVGPKQADPWKTKLDAKWVTYLADGTGF